AAADALEQWLTAYTGQGDTGASVRAARQRDELRAELAQRRDQQTDAEQFDGWDTFRQELDALTLEAPDPSGTQDVSRAGIPLGTVVATPQGYCCVPDGQLALGDGPFYASPQGAAVALARSLPAPQSRPEPA